MKVYKLTDKNGCTRGPTQWDEGVRHEATGEGVDLCSDGWIHAYEHPLLAVLLNPMHADFKQPRLWEAEGEGEPLRDGQLKLGFKALTTLREIPLPQITLNQRVAFAIYCAQAVCQDPAWNDWAGRWLAGEDRSAAAAAAAWEVAAAAACEAAREAVWAARAARAARAEAAAAARAAWAVEATAAWAAATAAAAWAAVAWVRPEIAEARTIDLISLAERALVDPPEGPTPGGEAT